MLFCGACDRLCMFLKLCRQRACRSVPCGTLTAASRSSSPALAAALASSTASRCCRCLTSMPRPCDLQTALGDCKKLLALQV